MNKLVPSVEIELDEPRKIVLDLNAMVDFGQATGRDLLDPTSVDKVDTVYIRAMLWACLKAGGSDLTLEEVGALVNLGNMKYIGEKLTELRIASMPESDDEEVKNPESSVG